MKIVNGDITTFQVDGVVNAANGIGFMGGWIGRWVKLPGVAESLHYATKGRIEREAKHAARKHRWLPRLLCGHRAGKVYVTSGGGLPAPWVIHAVTMRYPGMRTSYATIEQLLPHIIAESRRLRLRSVAIPLLGTGTGGLHAERVMELMTLQLADVTDMEIYIIIYNRNGGTNDV